MWQKRMENIITNERSKLSAAHMCFVFGDDWEARKNERISKKVLIYSRTAVMAGGSTSIAMKLVAPGLHRTKWKMVLPAPNTPRRTCCRSCRSGAVDFEDVANEWQNICGVANWLRICDLPYLASSTKSTAVVWEPSGEGGIQIYTDCNNVPAVFIGRDEGSDRVVHLLYSGSDVDCIQNLSRARV